MRSIFTLNLISLICLIAVSCNEKRDVGKKDLRGVWKVTGDSSLVVIYDRDFYLHRKAERDIYLNYSVSGDSIELFQDGITVFKRRIMLISKDEFLVTDSLFELRFSRIQSQVDTAKLRALVNWLKQPPTYSEDYFAEHELKFDETQDIWLSITEASR